MVVTVNLGRRKEESKDLEHVLIIST